MVKKRRKVNKHTHARTHTYKQTNTQAYAQYRGNNEIVPLVHRNINFIPNTEVVGFLTSRYSC